MPKSLLFSSNSSADAFFDPTGSEMRMFAVLLLSVAAPIMAQQPEILDLAADGFVTWANPDTSAYFATDWTWNLRYDWIQPDSVARATQSVMRTHFLDAGDPAWDDCLGLNLRTYAGVVGDTADALFVRVRISPEPLTCGRVTNWLRVCNASTSALENLVFGIESGIGNRFDDMSAHVPLLPPQSNTAY